MPSGIRRRKAMKAGTAGPGRRRRTKDKKKHDIMSNPIIAANWDHSQTLTQNYQRLGLASKLQKPTGGSEKDLRKTEEEQVPAAADIRSNAVREGRIVRHEDGTTSIEYTQLDPDAEEESVPAATAVVEQLEALAAQPGAKYDRHQSDREQDWIAALVDKHGDDFTAMQWDKKLNKFQQSAGDLKRRVKKWQKSQAKAAKA